MDPRLILLKEAVEMSLWLLLLVPAILAGIQWYRERPSR